MTTREQAMQWWNGLASLRKTQLCDTNTDIVGSVRRWETLTGREIEKIWRKENKTENIYLNRLKEQYISFSRIRKVKIENGLTTKIYTSSKTYYDAMRLFCLDTQLVSFNDIEAMESEVNQSF